MERPGEKLRKARERLALTYRDVAEASQAIAERRGNDEFLIALSRLADIENKGTVPTIYRMYTLCAIYRLDFQEVLSWYGVPLKELTADALQIKLASTHALQFANDGLVLVPEAAAPEVDPLRTSFWGRAIGTWGTLPVRLLTRMEPQHLQYGYIGLEDWSMYPILQPGSLVVIDPSRRKIQGDGWTNERERPIYFLEHHQGYLCGWCAVTGDRLVVLTHPASQQPPKIYAIPEIDIIGQVTGVATSLESKKCRRARISTTPAESPNQSDRAGAPLHARSRGSGHDSTERPGDSRSRAGTRPDPLSGPPD